MKKICCVALSGGVDSAAAALMLKNDGFEVRGVTLRLKPGSLADADVADASRVAQVLGIPFTVLDMREEFRQVTDLFCNEYLAGRTPNPCVFCNPNIKFGKLLQYALENGGDFLATGHYASVGKDENGCYTIEKNPTGKDQSYFLCRLNQHILSHVLFPLASADKSAVRALASQAGITVAEKPDSQEVCFIPDNDYIGFIEREKNPPQNHGDIKLTDGTVVGAHSGLYRYTVGQRKGLGAFGKPMYALRLEPETNTLYVGDNAELFKSGLIAEDLSFISGKIPEKPFSCEVKIRCAAKPAEAVLTPLEGGKARVDFLVPQRAVCPGQTAAVYSGNILLGAGTITSDTID